MQNFKEFVTEADEGELEKFVRMVKEINVLLTDASRVAERLTVLKDPGLKKQAEELEKKIDAARRFAFKIR